MLNSPSLFEGPIQPITMSSQFYLQNTSLLPPSESKSLICLQEAKVKSPRAFACFLLLLLPTIYLLMPLDSGCHSPETLQWLPVALPKLLPRTCEPCMVWAWLSTSHLPSFLCLCPLRFSQTGHHFLSSQPPERLPLQF